MSIPTVLNRSWDEGKGTYRGPYRHISPKYFPRYLNEMVGRHNIRGMDIMEQMKFLVSGMLGKRLTYLDLVGTEVPPTPFTHHRSKERANLSEGSSVEFVGELWLG